ncbi:MAG TPA: sugar phosphate nucleotidyltransferase [Nitrososphaerales archaeon]|nr:sugar phosphate nucleotidyltransferase [Nitrososphaerales archaeon]
MKAVLLVGGAGTRMRPLTYVVPKCLLPVGGKPLLERTMRYLGTYGITEFVLCVAYLKKQIMDTFGDGSSLGVRIEYAQADSPLGTAGQLRTAGALVDGTFVAMNGDIITNLNIAKLVETHKKRHAVATIALKEFGVKIPYGHILLDNDGGVKAFEEKPTLNYMANAGVYVLEPKVIDSIPPRVACSLETETFPKLISQGEKVGSYFEEAYWADVGSMADFERVNNEALEDPSIIAPQRPERID